MDRAEHIAVLLGVGCADTVLSWGRKVEKSCNPDVVAALTEGNELKTQGSKRCCRRVSICFATIMSLSFISRVRLLRSFSSSFIVM